MKLPIPAWYRSPFTQVVMVGFTCFCTVGMYSAVSNLGAGGTKDVVLSDMANGALMGCSAVAALFAGGVTNLLGVRSTLFIGTLGYSLYIGSLWCFQTQGTRWFVVFAGALLGISAALLWNAQGTIMLSYPLEKDKGKAFGIFWAIFQLGSFIGALIALAINLHSGELSAVSTGTYVAFLTIMFIGTTSALLLLPPTTIIRGDGSLIELQHSPSSPREELRSLFMQLADWRMLALTPMFFSANYFYAYHAAINTFYFDGPTRAVNATLEGAGAIVGAILIGFILDAPGSGLKRRTRGYLGLAFLSISIVVTWSCALAWQLTLTRGANITKMSYRDKDFTPKAALYFFFYFGDSAYQALAYWIMGAITNDPSKLARYVAFYKALQSAGAAGSYGMDAAAVPFLNEHLASWIMMLVALPLAGIVISTVHDTSYEDEITVFVEDLKDEKTGADVVVAAEELKVASPEHKA
ncbi:MFS general substrate transporter [Peniophora sp. CONT]|nr:MFS general substrate transporter [Peniophora sp. CONT]